MQIVRPTRAWLLLGLCAAAIGCSGEPATQIVTGHVALDEGAVAVRAVSGTSVVTAAEVRTDGSFTLVLPSGATYRLEVLTRSGALKHLVAGDGASLRDVVFRVCKPVAPYSVGTVAKCGDPGPGCDPTTDPNCKCDAAGNCPPPPCQPGDPNCGCLPDGTCPPPQPCDPATDPTCKCDAAGNCPPPPCQPGDPNCGCLPDGTCPPPEPCDPKTNNCPPPPQPCDPTTDPNCKCDAAGNCPPPPCQPGDPNCGCLPDGTCPPCQPGDPNCGCLPDGTCPPPQPGCNDPSDPNCKCDPSTGQNCVPPPPCQPGDPSCGTCTDPNTPGCLPPCPDPTDPNTCKDQCVDDPGTCGCNAGEPNCWPAPSPCDADGTCKPGEGVTAQNPPGDFGCAEGPAR